MRKRGRCLCGLDTWMNYERVAKSETGVDRKRDLENQTYFRLREALNNRG